MRMCMLVFIGWKTTLFKSVECLTHYCVCLSKQLTNPWWPNRCLCQLFVLLAYTNNNNKNNDTNNNDYGNSIGNFYFYFTNSHLTDDCFLRNQFKWKFIGKFNMFFLFVATTDTVTVTATPSTMFWFYGFKNFFCFFFRFISGFTKN